jgi:hypothetical protein
MHKKSYKQTSLTNMRKSEKRAYFCHVFSNSFLGAFLINFFNNFKISVKFCIFKPHIEYFNKKFCSYWPVFKL